MKDLVTVNKDKQLTTTTLKIAETFGKRHDNVMQKLESLDLPKSFTALNFKGGSYLDKQNQERPMYNVTRDGFTFLVMGFTGKKAVNFKIAYIEAFNKMESFIKEKLYEKTQLKLTAMGRTLSTVRQKMLALTEYASISQYCDDKNIKSTFWPKSKIGKLCSKISREKGISRKIGGGFGNIPTRYYIPIINSVFKLMYCYERQDRELKMLYIQLCLTSGCKCGCWENK